VGKRYLDLPFLLLARLGTLAKVLTGGSYYDALM